MGSMYFLGKSSPGLQVRRPLGTPDLYNIDSENSVNVTVELVNLLVAIIPLGGDNAVSNEMRGLPWGEYPMKGRECDTWLGGECRQPRAGRGGEEPARRAVRAERDGEGLAGAVRRRLAGNADVGCRSGGQRAHARQAQPGYGVFRQRPATDSHHHL